MEALGLLITITDSKFLLTSLMLIDVLSTVNTLTLWLQTSPSVAEITQLRPIVEKTVAKLREIASQDANTGVMSEEEILEKK